LQQNTEKQGPIRVRKDVRTSTIKNTVEKENQRDGKRKHGGRHHKSHVGKQKKKRPECRVKVEFHGQNDQLN
jgi:hypothetical protein